MTVECSDPAGLLCITHVNEWLKCGQVHIYRLQQQSDIGAFVFQPDFWQYQPKCQKP